MQSAARSVTSKVAGILGAITSSPYRSLSEIARVTGLPLSTVHRLLRELVTSGLVQRSEHGNYSLGRWAAAGSIPADARDLQELGRPVLHDLAAATKRRVSLGLRDHLTVERSESFGGDPVATLGFAPKVQLPLHASALGKALLAYSPEPVLRAVLAQGLERYTEHTIVDEDQLRAELISIRRIGVACSWGEFTTCSGAAVVVRDPSGTIAAAIAVEVFDHDDVARLQPPLVLAARTFTRRLSDAAGYSRRGGGAPRGRTERRLPNNPALPVVPVGLAPTAIVRDAS